MSVGVLPFIEKMQLGRKRGVKYDGRILLTGDTGFFGTNLKPYLEEAYPTYDMVYPQGRKFFDLTNPQHVRAMFGSIMNAPHSGPINKVVHLAAYSGGMFENMSKQASFWYQNMMLIINMLEQCAVSKVSRLLIPIGGCSYPNVSDADDGLFHEENLWNGFPNANSFGYSMAKKQAIVGAMAYDQQFSVRTTVVIPTNPIGPWDNINPDQSHVPMALMRRMLEAKEEGYSSVTIYGSGKPVRDFLFIDDIVSLFPVIMERYTDVGPLNISSGIGVSIAELAETIAKAVGYTGKLVYDTAKPDGQMHKVLANTKLKTFLEEEGLAWSPTPLDEAIARTVEWYERRGLYDNRS